ncbi:unnamed protein product [Choristocarpus tenellus]
MSSKDFISGILSRRTSSAGNPNAAPRTLPSEDTSVIGDKNPKDIPREDLVNLCMKLSKRLEVVEARSMQLTQAHKAVLQERQELLDFFAKEVVGNPAHTSGDVLKGSGCNEGSTNIRSMRSMWQKMDSERSLLLHEIQSSYQEAVRSKEHELQKQEAVHQKELLDLQKRLEESMLGTSDTKVVEGVRENGVPALIQGGTLQGEDSKETFRKVALLKEEIKQVLAGKQQLEHHLQRIMEENEEMVRAMRADLSGSQEEVTKLSKANAATKADLESVRGKMNAQLNELEGLKQVLNERDALLARIRTESQSAETVHATRTAMIATMQQEVVGLKGLLADKDKELQKCHTSANSLHQQCAKLERALADVHASLAKEKELKGQEEEQRKTEQQAHNKDVEDAVLQERREWEERFAEASADSARRSAMARKMAKENEMQVLALRTQIAKLEVSASGDLSEKRIIELAQTQAAKGSRMVQQLEEREKYIQRLKASLENHERLAEENKCLRQQVSDASRRERREGVNLEYLKNVIVKYMAFSVGSSERATLVPVIGEKNMNPLLPLIQLRFKHVFFFSSHGYCSTTVGSEVMT